MVRTERAKVMKKQAQKNVSLKELSSLAKAAKVPEIAPPTEANRDMSTGKYTMSFKDALQKWFRTTKQVSTSDGHLGVKDELLDAKATAANKPLLHKKGSK